MNRNAQKLIVQAQSPSTLQRQNGKRKLSQPPNVAATAAQLLRLHSCF